MLIYGVASAPAQQQNGTYDNYRTSSENVQCSLCTSNIHSIICLCAIFNFAGMTILYAYYGISCASHIDVQNQIRSTNWARSLCDGRNSCSGRVHTSVLTDPYFGCSKDFLVIARCANGLLVSNLVTPEAQGKDFSLVCPCSTDC